MIKIAFFDVGETLVHSSPASPTSPGGFVPFPGVHAALEAISGFVTAAGERLVLGIISDFGPEVPGDESSILAVEKQFCEQVLLPADLLRFFEPFDKFVTLSHRAGARKPERKIFDVALQRSMPGLGATLEECLFVTENVSHLLTAQGFHLTPVQFGGAGAAFTDWADAPAVLANLVTPGSTVNVARVVAPQLAAEHGLLNFSPTKGNRAVQGHATRLVTLHDARLGAFDGLQVELPSSVTADLDRACRVANVEATSPSEEKVADAVNYVLRLIESGRVALPDQEAPRGATHAIERDAAGRLRLVRRAVSTK